MPNYIKISLGIFLALAASRFIPHPPNFTSLLALSFYVPALMGRKFLPALIFSFVITDFFIGFHGTTLFTWGSVLFIGLISKYFTSSILTRIFGSLTGACIFFIITNLAIPFFTYSVISTFIFASVIETIYKIKFIKTYIKKGI